MQRSVTPVSARSYAGWVVLLTPARQVDQRVEFSVRYALAVGPDADYRPTQKPVDFRLGLAASAENPEAIAPSLTAGSRDGADEYRTSVFICYAHDTPAHKAQVREFAELLAAVGLDVRIDQWDENGRKDWAVWALRLINDVDFVIVLASPICRKAFDGELRGPENPGIRSESQIIKEKLHAHRDEWTAKVLPVVLPHELADNIPQMLQPWTTDHYDVQKLTREASTDCFER